MRFNITTQRGKCPRSLDAHPCPVRDLRADAELPRSPFALTRRVEYRLVTSALDLTRQL